MLQKIRWLLFSKEPHALRVRQIIKVFSMIILFGVLFWIVPFGDVISALFETNLLFFGIGLFFSLISSYLTAIELHVLTNKLGIPHTVNQIFALNLAVKFYTLVTPTTLVGSGVRWYRLGQPTKKLPQSLAAMFLFRSLEMFLVIVFGISFWLLSDRRGGLMSSGWIIIISILIILSWFILIRLSENLMSVFGKRVMNISQKPFWKWLVDKIHKFLLALSEYKDLSFMQLATSITAGLVSILVGVVSAVFIVRSVGVELTYLQMGWITAVVMLATQMPFAGVGGLGVREVSLVTIMPLVGVLPDKALAYSFLLFIRGVIISLLGGVVEAFQVLKPHQVDI